MTKQEKFIQPWKEFAGRWGKYYTPPGRPSKEAIKTYSAFIKEAIKGLKRKPRGLVLGATPELRDLLTELKFEVTMIDINLEMILAMSELTKKKNPDEIIVKANWLSNPLASNYFDLILGDLVLANVSLEKQTQFLKEIKRLLKLKGYWITKIEVMPNDWEVEKFETVLKKFAKAPWHSYRAMELFCHLLNNTWGPKTKATEVRKIKKWMEKYKIRERKYQHPDKKVTRHLNHIWEMWRPMKKEWAFRSEKETVEQLSPYFKVVKKVVINDCYYRKVDESFPIWLCRSKK